jgi:hypothetical protein
VVRTKPDAKTATKLDASKATYADDPTEPNRCHAAMKSDGKRCPHPATSGRAVCRLHGGLTPRGADSWMRALGEDFGKAFEDAKNSRDLMDLRRPLAMLHVHVEKAAARLAERDTPNFRERCRDMLTDARELIANGDAGGEKALGDLAELIEQGVEEDKALVKLTNIVERYAKRAEEAWKVHLHRAEVVNRADLIQIYEGILKVIVEEVGKDDATRIVERLQRIALAN